jgi:hypothetical protein
MKARTALEILNRASDSWFQCKPCAGADVAQLSTPQEVSLMNIESSFFNDDPSDIVEMIDLYEKDLDADIPFI